MPIPGIPHVPVSNRPEEDRIFFQMPAPYRLNGPVPDVSQGDPAIVYSAARHLCYYVMLNPGLVMQIDPIGFSPDQPRWYVSFNEKDGKHVFHEAGAWNVVCRNMWEFIEYMLEHCKRKTPMGKVNGLDLIDHPALANPYQAYGPSL